MSKGRKPAPEGLEREFKYLDLLRESGVTNMFGAAPYLAREFNIPQKEASAILVQWMNAFS